MTTVYSYSAGSPRARARMAVTRYKCAACTYIQRGEENARRGAARRIGPRVHHVGRPHYRGENERPIATMDTV